jgi:actin-related protein
MYLCADTAMAQLMANSLSKVDIDLRSAFYSEIVLTGGNTMIDGFP